MTRVIVRLENNCSAGEHEYLSVGIEEPLGFIYEIGFGPLL